MNSHSSVFRCRWCAAAVCCVGGHGPHDVYNIFLQKLRRNAERVSGLAGAGGRRGIAAFILGGLAVAGLGLCYDSYPKYSLGPHLSPCFLSTSLTFISSNVRGCAGPSDTTFLIPSSYAHTLTVSLTPAPATFCTFRTHLPQPKDNGNLHDLVYLSASLPSHSFSRLLARLLFRSQARLVFPASSAACQQYSARLPGDCVSFRL